MVLTREELEQQLIIAGMRNIQHFSGNLVDVVVKYADELQKIHNQRNMDIFKRLEKALSPLPGEK